MVPVRANFSPTLRCVFYANYSMQKNQEHHLIYALIITDLTYLTEMQSPLVVILPTTNIDLTNMQNLQCFNV